MKAEYKPLGVALSFVGDEPDPGACCMPADIARSNLIEKRS